MKYTIVYSIVTYDRTYVEMEQVETDDLDELLYERYDKSRRRVQFIFEGWPKEVS